jgi:ferredoxin
MGRAKKTRVAVVAWLSRPLPVVDERRCTGCGWCAAVCPADALTMEGGLPMLVRPAACVSCGLCADVCPTKAITLATADHPAK